MSRSVTVTVIASALLAATVTPAAAGAGAEQIAAVEGCLPGIWGEPRRYLDQVYAERDLDKARKCAAAAKAVLDAGGASAEVRVPDKIKIPIVREASGSYYARIDKVSAYAAGYHDRTRIAAIRSELEYAQETDAWYDTLEEVGEDEMHRLEGAAANCVKAVDRGAALGLGAAVPVELARSLVVPFGELKAKVCAPVQGLAVEVRKSIEAAAKAEIEKKVAPYRKLLAGEKLATFIEREMYDLSIYGKGGALLQTPEDFKKASLWFQVLGRTDDLGREWWTLRRFQFKGNKLVKVTEDTGPGSMPPSARYR